jgi:branched-chain amino acid transport system ATP-binding protein
MGKTTLVNSLIGLTRRFAGAIFLEGRDVTRLRPDARARAGIAWVPQRRCIFHSLSVEENLVAAMRPGPWTLTRTFDLFPRLKGRRGDPAGLLDAGEQQMLAIGRALLLNPMILLFDEPFAGLLPTEMEEVGTALRTVVRDEGVPALLAGQNGRRILALADRAVILEHGRIVREAASAEIGWAHFQSDPAAST